MGRIIPYIMENKNCSKPPTRFTMTNRTRGTQRGTQRVALVSVTWQNDPWNIDQISSTMGHQGSSIGQKTSKSCFFLKTWVPPNHPKVDHFRTPPPPYEPRHSHWTSSLSTMNPLWRRRSTGQPKWNPSPSESHMGLQKQHGKFFLVEHSTHFWARDESYLLYNYITQQL